MWTDFVWWSGIPQEQLIDYLTWGAVILITSSLTVVGYTLHRYTINKQLDKIK